MIKFIRKNGTYQDSGSDSLVPGRGRWIGFEPITPFSHIICARNGLRIHCVQWKSSWSFSRNPALSLNLLSSKGDLELSFIFLKDERSKKRQVTIEFRLYGIYFFTVLCLSRSLFVSIIESSINNLCSSIANMIMDIQLNSNFVPRS